MNFEILTNSREELIQVGETIGHVFLSQKQERPWAMTLGDAPSSGKSLVALAVDKVFNPRAYPQGITEDHHADVIIYQRPKNSVVFLNVSITTFYPTKSLMDLRLEQIARGFPAANVIICSNLQRSNVKGAFNYAVHGLQSDRLDLNIDFEIGNAPFGRRLIGTTDNPQIYKGLENSGLAFKAL